MKTGLVKVLLLLDDGHVHLAQEGANRLLHPAPLHRRPAVLHSHALATVVWEGEVLVPVDQIPYIGKCARLGTLLDDIGAVVA